MFSIFPASTSDCCTSYVAVAVAFSPGSSVVALSAPSWMPSSTSVSSRLLTVTFPVFSTSILYVTVSPTATPLSSDVFVTLMDGSAVSVVTVQSSSSDTSPPFGSVPVAVAVFSIFPASTSDCCTSYVAVAVAVSSGASVVALSAPSWMPSSTSVSASPLTVTLPVFLTVIEYVTVSPTATPLSSELFVTSIEDAAASVVTIAVASPLTFSPFGSFPVAVTLFVMLPLSTSAWVTSYVAVAVAVAAAVSPGAIVVLSSAPSWMPGSGSVSVRSFTVWFPVFVTVIVYVIVSPTATLASLSAFFVTVSAGFPFSVSTVQSSSSDTSLPCGSSPAAVALLSIFPASTSFWATVYVAVAVAVSSGASVVALSAPSVTPSSTSVSSSPLTVTLPMFFTVIV